MNKIFFKLTTFAVASAIIFASSSCATASRTSSSSSTPAASASQSNQSVLGNTVTNLLQGVLKKSNLKVSDIYGEWTADGSAVCFKSDNFLKKAGGLAAAGAVEAKINPYFQKLGLDKAVLTVNNDDTFTIAVGPVKISGTIAIKDEKQGIFIFTFKLLGMQLGSFDTYIQKSGNHLDVMFDADKLMSLISTVAKITGNNMATTAASIIDSYDGLCLGFSMNKTGSIDAPAGNGTQQNSTSGQSAAGGFLQNIFNGGSQSSSQSSTKSDASTPTQTQNTKSTPSTQTTQSNPTTNSKNETSDPGQVLFNLLKKK